MRVNEDRGIRIKTAFTLCLSSVYLRGLQIGQP